MAGSPDDGRAGRPRLAVAVLRDPLRRRARPGGPARGVGARACSTTPPRRPRTSRWCWRTAAAPRAAACSTSCASSRRVTEVKSAPLTAREFPGFVVNELRARKVRIDPDAADFLIQAVGQDLRSLVGRDQPARQRLRGPAADRRDGQEVLRRPGRGQVVRGGRPHALRPDRQGARGAALGAGPRHRAGAGHQRDGRRPAQPGQVHVRAARDAQRRPDARGRGARPGSCDTLRASPTAGTSTASAGRSGRSPAPTPTSRARPATRRTRWRRWCLDVGARPASTRLGRLPGQAEGAVPDGVRRLS